MPLTDEEWEALAGPLVVGDRDAMDRVLVEAVRFATWCSARESERRGIRIDLEDVAAEATMHVFRHIRKFDPGRGVPLKKYMALIVRSAVRTKMRSVHHEHSLDEAEEEFGFMAVARPESAAEIDEDSPVLRALAKLGATDREVIESLYGFNGRPREAQCDIARRLGVTKQRVSQRVQKAERAIKVSIREELGVERSTEG